MLKPFGKSVNGLGLRRRVGVLKHVEIDREEERNLQATVDNHSSKGGLAGVACWLAVGHALPVHQPGNSI